MITLHDCARSRGLRVVWMLEELGLPYTLKMMPFPPVVHDPSFLDINPVGTVPTLFDGSMRMTESAAICEYLAAKYGPTSLAVTPQEPGFGAYLNFLHAGEGTLTFPLAVILRYTVLEPAERRVAQVAEDYKQQFFVRLRLVECALQDSPYVAADRFTAADISVGYALLLANMLGYGAELSAIVRQYWERLQQREAFQRAVAAEQGVK